MIRTKIICTLGPSCDNDEVMRGLLENGMDCARMNFSHGSHQEHKERLERFRRIRDELKLNTAVLLDTKGPEIRTGEFENKVELIAGQAFLIAKKDIIGNDQEMSISYKDLATDVQIGQSILIDDGLVELSVNKIEKNGDVYTIVENGGWISSKKSVNIPGAHINLPSITERDESDILFAIENDYDFIAISFVRRAEDVQNVRRFLDAHDGSHIQLISKIENQQGVDNIDEIIQISDGIMVARGDLGVEIPVQEVPIAQKYIIKNCIVNFKIVIIATQMLDSMIRNPRPTRAETSDVANAIFDGTTCTMLSGETANGKYPIESLKTMVDIARTAEASINFWKRMKSIQSKVISSVTGAISYASCSTAQELKASAIVTVSQSGYTARAISRFHPACPIICATPQERVERQLRLQWGVFPFLSAAVDSTDSLFDLAMNIALESNFVEVGDLIVITAGVPVGISGTTNTIKVQLVGDLLASGISIGNKKEQCTTNVLVVKDPDLVTLQDCEGRIVVSPILNEKLLPKLRKARAVLIEGSDNDGYAEAAQLALDIPIIVEAAGVCRTLKTGTVVTLEVSESRKALIKHS